MSSPVSLDVTEGVALIGLHRPEHRNAIDLPMARALRDTVAEARRLSKLGAVVLFGHGTEFCVGGDLQEFSAAADRGALVGELATTAHDAVLELRSLPAPLISAVHGACAGGGLGFALAADLVVAEHTARFVVAYTAAGLTPDCGVSWVLPRLVGPPRANDLILTNRELDGADAERLGMVSRVVESGTAYEHAIQLARSLADGPRPALAESTRLVRSANGRSLEAHLQAEADSIVSVARTRDAGERIAAVLQKGFRSSSPNESTK